MKRTNATILDEAWEKLYAKKPELREEILKLMKKRIEAAEKKMKDFLAYGLEQHYGQGVKITPEGALAADDKFVHSSIGRDGKRYCGCGREWSDALDGPHAVGAKCMYCQNPIPVIRPDK